MIDFDNLHALGALPFVSARYTDFLARNGFLTTEEHHYLLGLLRGSRPCLRALDIAEGAPR